MADASIPLGYKPPVIESPFDMQTKALNLTHLAQATQLNAARIQEEKIKAQNAAEDREDESKIQQGFMDPSHRDEQGHLNWDKFYGSMQGKVRMRNLQRLDKDHLDQVKAVQDMATSDRINGTAKTQQLIAHNNLIGQEIQGLESLPDNAKPDFYQGSLKRLQAAGVDVSGLPPTIPPDGSFNEQLNAFAAATGYQKRILSDAQKKVQADLQAAQARRAEQQAATAAQKETLEAKQVAREEAAQQHLGVTDQASHDAWLASLPDSVAGEFKNLKTFNPRTADIIQQMPLKSKDRITTAETAGQHRQAEEQRRVTNETRQDTNDIRREGLDLRRDLADQAAALRRELAGGTGTGRKLTPGQILTQERNISALENGNASRPGLSDLRIKYGSQLKANMDDQPNRDDKSKIGNVLFDEKGKLTPAGQSITDKLTAATRNLQQQQYRKADLYGVGKPDASEVDSAPDGTEVEAPDGSVWKKSGGVAFFSRMGGGAAPAAKPAAAAPKAAAAQPEIPVGKRFKNSAGVVIKWDGKQFVDEKTGKPYKQ